MRKKAKKDEDLKDSELGREESGENGSPDSLDEPKEDDRYAYKEGEFNPDEWENYNPTKKRRFFQNGMGLFVSIIALILFAALFVVEFRSYTKVKTGDSGYVSEKKEDTANINNTILKIIETGSNYTIYLDNNTGIEYVMFRVGSSISVQPLINPDGSYKRHVEPATSAESSSEAASKYKWSDSLKLPDAVKPTSAPPQPSSQPAT